MKKIGIALIVLAAAMIIAPASPYYGQSAAANTNDVFGSHEVNIYPRPANTFVTKFQADPSNLVVSYVFASPNNAGINYKDFFFEGLPRYQWVDLKTNKANGTTQEITATASSWLKDNGLQKIDVTIDQDGITVHAYMKVTYVNNECIFYWSKFYTS